MRQLGFGRSEARTRRTLLKHSWCLARGVYFEIPNQAGPACVSSDAVVGPQAFLAGWALAGLEPEQAHHARRGNPFSYLHHVERELV